MQMMNKFTYIRAHAAGAAASYARSATWVFSP